MNTTVKDLTRPKIFSLKTRRLPMWHGPCHVFNPKEVSYFSPVSYDKRLKLDFSIRIDFFWNKLWNEPLIKYNVYLYKIKLNSWNFSMDQKWGQRNDSRGLFRSCYRIFEPFCEWRKDFYFWLFEYSQRHDPNIQVAIWLRSQPSLRRVSNQHQSCR